MQTTQVIHFLAEEIRKSDKSNLEDLQNKVVGRETKANSEPNDFTNRLFSDGFVMNKNIPRIG